MVTRRLVLRMARRGDAAALERVLDDVVVEAQGWTPRTRAAMLTAVRSRRTRRAVVVACDRETGEALGTVTVYGTQSEPALGINIGPAGRGRGLGFEVVQGMVERLRAARVERVVLETAVTNGAMRRIAEATGFTVVAHYMHALPNGAHVRSLRYVLDLRARRPSGPTGPDHDEVGLRAT